MAGSGIKLEAINRQTVSLCAAPKLDNRFKSWKFYTREKCK
jgi:hypothetical protein